MPLNVKCKNCNNYRNDWCEKVIDSPDPDIKRDCQHFWEKTNADRIRAMSDEELAKILGDKCICPPIGECAKVSGDCEKCWFEWLQQPAEEDVP